ncbi:hypothetical protein [Carboxylicivirga taeanensis]|uniref:hypothetical protein n=1 Tax=Carboxylicivirga taeanensis TaxID=1416875 RepID=UPI003F6E0117
MFCLTSFGQYSTQTDSLQESTQLSLNLKLEYLPVKLSINSSEINKVNRPIYLYNQVGMYEQYHLSVNSSQMLRSYKAYYPADLMTITGNNRVRDSFNPHGANDIGSALINGFLNGILLGNKY